MPPNRAQIVYSNGILSVSADNSSLNQILRQIATDIGLKITGSVADERVFGKYGPEGAAEVLNSLLDGTSSNMVLVQRGDSSLAELILTPRQGGPTPPNPSAASNDKPEPPQNRPEDNRSSEPSPQPSSQSNPTIPPVDPAANSNPNNTSQPDSPNGVKTPQQIYEQLQRLRQQQQPQSQPATTPAQPPPSSQSQPQ
jgi:hypothetical protein